VFKVFKLPDPPPKLRRPRGGWKTVLCKYDPSCRSTATYYVETEILHPDGRLFVGTNPVCDPCLDVFVDSLTESDIRGSVSAKGVH